MGIGGIARPMVVGDRLWLFTQPVNSAPPTPIQSMLLNNVPPSPQHYSPMITSSRPFSGSEHSRSPITASSLNSQNYLSKSLRPDYRFNRESSDFRFNKVLIKSQPEESIHLSPHSSNGLADLESRFGQNSSILNSKSKFQDAIGDEVKSSSSSDVDCEEIEINDEN